MKVVHADGVLEALDDRFCPTDTDEPRAVCYGDFRHAKAILAARGFTDADFFDVFHVLMARGGYCDCEILYNVAEGSRLAMEYWRDRTEGREPSARHKLG